MENITEGIAIKTLTQLNGLRQSVVKHFWWYKSTWQPLKKTTGINL
jgi:hypothetical protein